MDTFSWGKDHTDKTALGGCFAKQVKIHSDSENGTSL